MRQRTVIIFFLIALLAGFVMPATKVSADAILFPWIVKGDTISTYISVINTAQDTPGDDLYPLLHYHYWFKESTANEHNEGCTVMAFVRLTSWNDIVTFDASGITNNGKAMFNEAASYVDLSFKLSLDAPRRAFLIVDNNTPLFTNLSTNYDGTLYGEALIIDHATGMMWGYTAFNARGAGVAAQQTDQVYFNDGFDYQGEVIGGNESGRLVLLPPSEYTTKFYVTPIGMNGQRNGHINAQVYFAYYNSPFGNYSYGGIYDNNENPIDFTKKVNVTCTTALTLQDLFTEAAYTMFSSSGTQGWAYMKTAGGTAPDYATAQAVIGKLDWKTVTQTVSPDLSGTEGCTLCKEGCMSKCKKNDYVCQFSCAKKCKNLCSPKIDVETQQGNFNWIRSGDSLPLPVIAY